MTIIITIICGYILWKLFTTSRKQKIAYKRYMEDVAFGNDRTNRPGFMVDPNGRQHPTWCPNCGRNL